MTLDACQSEYSSAEVEPACIGQTSRRRDLASIGVLIRSLPHRIIPVALKFLPAILLLLPIKTVPRSLSPSGMESLKLSELSLSAPLMSAAPATFNIAVAQDIGVDGRTLSLADVATTQASTYWAQHSDTLKNFPLLFNYTVAFSIANYDRTNRCHLTLTLSGIYTSKPLDCRTLQDNGLARFQFDQPIPPGVYQSSLTSTGDAHNAVALYWKKDAQGKYWVPAFSWQGKTPAIQALYLWGHAHPWQASLYGLSIILMMVGFHTSRSISSITPWFSILLSLYLGMFLIAAPLSGHDETAHIDMFKRSLLETTNIPQETINKSLSDHYVSLRDYMLHEHFFRLHNAVPQAVGACSHSILNSCGESERPLRLYHLYGQVLQKLGVTPSSPSEIQWTGRSLNYLWLALFLAGILCVFPRRYALATVITLTFSGALLGQIASVTNDVPMYLTGLWGAVALAYFIVAPTRWQAWVGVGVFLALLSSARYVDQSWIAGLPATLLLLISAMVLVRPQHSAPALPSRTDQKIGLAAASTCVFALGVVGPFLLARHLMGTAVGVQALGRLIELGSAISPEFARLRALSILPLPQALQIIYRYFCSIYGSYVWGHSFYNDFVYLTLLVGTGVLCYFGAHKILGHLSRFKSGLILLVLGMVFATQLLAIVAIASPEFGPDVVRWQSYTKARLIAPGLSCVLPLPFLGVVKILETPSMAKRLFLILYIWSTLLLCYYWPAFFVIDAL